MKKIAALIALLYTCIAFPQANQPWRSFFSYNNTVDIAQSSNRIFAGADGAIFSKSVLTNELKTITSVDGFKPEVITAMYHSPTYNKTLVGNSNGLLLVVNGDNSILNVIDIIQEATVQANKKRINHIYEFEGKVYVSCDFGIVVFNLATLEFGDTYYLGPMGAEISVLQSTVFNGYIYAATPGNGIRKALLTNPNLNDFSQWTEDTPGQWAGILNYNGTLFAANTFGTLFRLQNNNFLVFTTLSAGITDLREANGYMAVTSPQRVNVFNNQLTQVLQINVIPGETQPLTFTCATVVTERIFIGTKEKGVFSAPLQNPFPFENIKPDGPERSNIFSLEKTPNFLWAVYGDFDSGYNPYDLEYFGVSKLTPTGWFTIPNTELFNAASIVDIAANPSNENELYAASYHSGLVKIDGETGTQLYNQVTPSNTGLESLVDPSDVGYRSVRVNSLAFDRTGTLWMTNARVKKAIKSLSAGGQWTSYDIDAFTGNALGDDYNRMVIDKNGTKWIPSKASGIIAFNETLGPKVLIIDNVSGNLPINRTKCVAIDNNNQLWIGTESGLRVLPGIDRFTTEDILVTNEIIIIDNGEPSELMFEQGIVDIEVDGSNNKWLGTATAGAFLVSPDGQRTIFHFTKENSPLPSNTINDISIDAATGEVFFATNRGMVSYQGTSTKAEDDLSKVYVFPNPVRPNFEGDVNISGLINNANVKITDIEGNLVYETTSEGGTVLWDTKAFGKHRVASGVYMIFITSDDGTKTKVKKVMIIR
ncbi:MAG: T9SS type A sorting domain-containing protein [Flavobacterium sp.]|nr:MAG: T9SS type A sorting domain-containing protein [Flavobacterium sp.]